MIAAAFWLLALSLSALLAEGLIWALLLHLLFGFDALSPAAWLQLHRGFLAGGGVPFAFVATLAGALLSALSIELLLILHLPGLLAWLPALPAPRLSRPAWRRPGRAPRPVAKASPPAAPPVAAAPPPAAGKEDEAAIARMLALLEVWNEPAPGWMVEALREEAESVRDEAWPLLRDLGAAAMRLLVLLEAQGLLPDRPAARATLAELLDRRVAEPPPSLAAEAEPAPRLTTGAAWLCELLDNFTPSDGEAIEDLLARALRGMKEEDWASLDRFPEKAGRVRVLTDRLSEQLRHANPGPPLDPLARIEALLAKCGFAIRSRNGPAGLLAERPDLLLLLRAVDLQGRSWPTADGLRGPGRQLWQELATARLRRAAGPAIRAALVLHDGCFADDAILAQAADDQRREGGIELLWLDETPGPLPSLARHLGALTATPLRERAPGSASRRAALQP
jgi:hypothetical protein